MSTSLGVSLFAEDSDSDVDDERDASDPNRVIVNPTQKPRGGPSSPLKRTSTATRRTSDDNNKCCRGRMTHTGKNLR